MSANRPRFGTDREAAYGRSDLVDSRRQDSCYAPGGPAAGVKRTVTEHDGRLLARIEDERMIFEVSFDELEATDVTLRFLRDGQKVGSIYNDYGTEKTMARLTVPGETDFIGVEVPKAFVAEVIDAAIESGRVADETAVEGYRLRVLS
jgi:hypothetical protein